MSVRKLATAVVVLCGVLLWSSCFAANAADELHELTSQWTSIERQRDELQSNWRASKPLLEQQLALLEREAAELQRVLDASEQEQGEVEALRRSLLEEQSRLEQEQAALEQVLVQAAISLNGLRPQLPPPLAEAWDAQLPRLDDPLYTSSEKLQIVLELLGQLDDFQRKITINESIMSLDGGVDFLVKQVYLGLSHGWYLSADGRLAAAGRATPEGWRWQEVTDARPVAEIIDIVERRRSPGLVTIPLRLEAGLDAGVAP